MFFGRKRESSKIVHSFSLVQRGAWRQVMVSGPAGVGKTALVRQFALTAEYSLGGFVFAKADPRRSGSPLSPVKRALNMMVKQAIADHPGDMEKIAESVFRRMGVKLDQAVCLVPALRFLIREADGKDHPGDPEGQHPFSNEVLYCLIEIFSSYFKGLVIFLDDLQWFDPASLRFLAYLTVAPPLPGVLMIMGFRSPQQGTETYFSRTIERFHPLDSCCHIALEGLPKRDIQALLKNRLNTARNLTPLSDLCFEKTRGNPFYLTQMVADLLDRGDLLKTGDEWTYDLANISAREISENVADLVIERIRHLDGQTRMLLRHAACIRDTIPITALAATSGLSPAQIQVRLWKPVKIDFLKKKGQSYTFSHDKILEAVGNLIPRAEKREIHRRLTAFYLSALPEKKDDASVFTLLYHYGFYKGGVTDPDLRKEMVPHYLRAGRESRARSDYAQALSWFRRGRAHYPGDIWQEDYDLALAFCSQSASCAFLSGNFKAAERISAEMDERAACYEDRLEVEMVKISCYHATGQLKKAMAKGLEILGFLGVHIPETPSGPRVVFAILKTWTVLAATASLTEPTRQMPDRVRKIVRVMTALGGVSFVMSPNRFLPLISALALEKTLRHGHCPDAPSVYLAFGMVLNRFTRSVKWGRRLSTAARAVSRAAGNASLSGKERFLSAVFMDHWDQSLGETAAVFEQSQRLCLKQEDHEYYAYHTAMSVTILLFTGLPLDRILARITREKAVIKQLNRSYGLAVLSIQQRVLENLHRGEPRPWDLDPDPVDEGVTEKLSQEQLHAEIRGLSFDRAFYRFCAAFFHGDMAAAFNLKRELDPFIEQEAGTPPYYCFCFMAAIVEINAGKKPKKYLKILRWCAANNPGVYGPRHRLALGELARVRGRLKKAGILFESAASELSSDSIYERGMVNERLGRIARDLNRTSDAQTYFQKAETLFRQWGLKYKHGLFAWALPEDLAQAPPPETLAAPCDDRPGQDPDGLEKALFQILEMADAQSVHAVVLETLQWKTKIRVSRNRTVESRAVPAMFADLPDKMLTFAVVSGEVLTASAGDAEEDFFDTAYFFRHRPSALMVVPDVENRAIFIENPKDDPDIRALVRLGQKAFEKIRLSYPAGPGPPPKDPDRIRRLKQCFSKLQDHMKQNRPYTDQELSLGSLASALNMSQRMLSDAVNTCLGQNVHTYINNYRIEAVKTALEKQENRERNVLEIAFEQGFNAKSTFNRTFKKQTGMTPSQYRDLRPGEGRDCRAERG